MTPNLYSRSSSAYSKETGRHANLVSIESREITVAILRVFSQANNSDYCLFSNFSLSHSLVLAFRLWVSPMYHYGRNYSIGKRNYFSNHTYQ
jgi:hypothetical protein